MGEFADYALEETFEEEWERYRYRQGEMTKQEAYEKGIINEYGGEEDGRNLRKESQ